MAAFFSEFAVIGIAAVCIGASTYISTCKHVEKRAYGSGLYYTKPVLLIAILRPSIAPRPSWLESNCLQR